MSNGLVESIIHFDDLHDSDSEFISVGNVTFKVDFGPWKKGDKAESLTIDYKRAYIEEYNSEGHIVNKCAIRMIVDSDRKPPVVNHEEDD